MACSQTKRLAEKDWPLFRTTDAGRCCYVIEVGSSGAAATVVADAQTQPDYVRRSQFYTAPGGKIVFYLYFKASA